MIGEAPENTTCANIERLIRPRSIAIVGASPKPGALGESVLSNLDEAGYSGDLYLINPKRDRIGQRPCIASVDDLPLGVDCAVLAIPRSGVLDAVAACARRKVGAVVIFSAGYAESGSQGRADQDALAGLARSTGMAIEGPNCLGFVNYVDATPLTFVSTKMQDLRSSSGVAIISQSGAMAAVLGVSLRHHDLTLSYSVSTGNEAALGVEDFLEYMIADEHTRVITMIVEQFRRPRKLLELAKRAQAKDKQIVLLHPGSSSAGRASAATHTGAMAGDYTVMSTKVEHAGVLLVDSVEQMVGVTDILVRCPKLQTGGTAVFTESGAFKALTLDTCERLSLALPPMSDGTAADLRNVLPEFISPTNPLDITAQALVDPDIYRRALPPVLADAAYGSVLLAIIMTDEATSGLKFPPIIAALKDIKPTKPVIFAALDEGARISPDYVEQVRELGVPFFSSTDRAFQALSCVARHADHVKFFAPAAHGTVEELTLESGTIPEYKSKQVLASVGIPTPQGALARSVMEALSIASEIGYPVALKAQASWLSHKSDVGGVALNLQDAAAVEKAWDKMRSDVKWAFPDLALEGTLVEKMGQGGAEIIVGAKNDSDWGPVLLVGFGGVLAEALKDVRLIVPELPQDAIIAELRKLKCAAMIKGFRGSPELDIDAVAEIVSRLGQLVLSTPLIREVDINPVIVYPKGKGAVALDALIVVDTPQPVELSASLK